MKDLDPVDRTWRPNRPFEFIPISNKLWLILGSGHLHDPRVEFGDMLHTSSRFWWVPSLATKRRLEFSLYTIQYAYIWRLMR
jgi:hypothetical protein